MGNDYSIYEHVFPNGKKYIGISCDPEKRWRNGRGYETQPKINNAIKRYGWDNIKHNIICDKLSRKQAEKLEQYLISALGTISNGYNTAIGGDRVNGTYLDPYILRMIWYVRKRCGWIGEKPWMVDVCENAKYDLEAAEFWNEASRAVLYRRTEICQLPPYSTNEESQVFEYWKEMAIYGLIHIALQKGKDIDIKKVREYMYGGWANDPTDEKAPWETLMG